MTTVSSVRGVLVVLLAALFLGWAPGSPARAAGSHIAAARYWWDGSLDTSFGNQGQVEEDLLDSQREQAIGVALGAAGGVVVAVDSDVVGAGAEFFHVFYDADAQSRFLNAADLPFSYEIANAAAQDSQGRFLTAGQVVSVFGGESFLIQRRKTDGTLDTSFDGDGWAAVTFYEPFFPFSPAAGQEAAAVTVDAFDRPVTAGWATIGHTIQFAVARHLASGAVDGSFGSGGTVLVDFPGSSTAVAAGVATDSQGRIVVAGRVLVGGLWRIGVARLTGTGALDTSFGSGGRVVTSFASASHVTAAAVVVDGSDRVLVAGSAEVASTGALFALVRYLSDGSLDTSFDGDGKVLTDFSSSISEEVFALGLDPWGDIVAAGTAAVQNGGRQFALARYTTSGALDTYFDSDGKVLTDWATGNHEVVLALAFDGWGRIIAVGGVEQASP